MIRINLLRPETKDIKERSALPAPELKEKKPPQIGNLILLLVVVAVAVLYFLQKKAFDNEQALLQAAQQEKEQLQFVITKLDQLQAQKANFEKKVNLITQLKAQQGIAVAIMDELSKYLPEWIWLTEVGCENMIITVKGNALSNNLIADYIFSLENSPVFKNVNLISSSQRTGQTGPEQYLEFFLNMEYVLPQSAAAAPPPAPDNAAQRGKK